MIHQEEMVLKKHELDISEKRFKIEQEHNAKEARFKRFMHRKKMKEEGFTQEEIDIYFPLPPMPM